MALHTGTIGGLGQVNGPLLETSTNVGGPNPSQTPPTVSSQSQQPPPAGFIKYGTPFGAPPQGHTNPGGDPYANGGGGGMMTAAYGEEGGGQPQQQQLQSPLNISPNPTQQQQPPTAAAPNTMQQQQQFVQSNQQQQRMVQPPPPTIIDPNSYLQHWNNAPGPGNSNAMATQQQQQPPPNFDEAAAAAAAMMTNGGAGGGVVVVSSGAQMNSSPTLPPTYNPPMGVGDRRLITSPPMGSGSTLQPQPPQQPGGMQYAPPRFTPPTQIYHHNPAMQPPSQTPPPGYLPMTHQDPSSMMNPAFVPSAGPPPAMMNGGQRMYAPGLPPLGGQRTAMRGPAPAMNFGYYPFPDGSQQPMAAMCPPPGGFQQMPPTAAAPGLHLQPSGDLQQQQPQPGPSTGRRNNANDATGGGSGTGKKKKTKATKTRAAPARGGSGRGGANAPNKVVGNPSVGMGGGSLPPVGAIGGPPMGSSQPPPSQMMGGPGMVGVLPQSGPPQMWSTSLPRSPSQPNPNIIPNGGSMNPMNLLQSPFTSTQQQQQIMVTQQTPAGTPHYGPTPHQRGRAMAQQHQQQHSALPQTGGMIQQPAQQMPQQQQQQQCHSPHFDSSEKLGYPIPNGLLVRSTKLQIDEDQARQSLNTPQVRVLEFDISQGHLSTIIGRSDLDIAISCHLASEPPQVCHWADDVLEIRFNDRVLPMDRRVLKDGSIAHKVATVKDFCNVTKNKLEIFLSPISRSSQTDLSLSDFLFTVFMIHMPSIKLVLEGSIRLILSSQLTFLKRIVEYCKPRDPHSQIFAAEIALVCPVFKTRIKIPARLSDCRHLEVFDFEAFLQNEALWPRLRCPICHSTATGIDGFVVDYVLHLLFPVVPERFNAIRVRSDAVWRPVISDAPGPEIEEWTPIFGPYTDSFAYYMEHGTQPPNHLPSLLTNGILEGSRHSPLTNKQSQQQRAPDNHQFNPSQPQFQSMVQLSSSYATTQPGKTEPEPNQKKRVLSTTQAPTSSLPDLTIGVEGVHANPKSLPSTPTFPKNSPTGPKPDSSNGGSNNLKRSRGSSFGEEETQNSHENPSKMSRLAIAQQSRQLNEDPETLAALQELPDLSLLSRPDVLEVIYSLTKSIKQ